LHPLSKRASAAKETKIFFEKDLVNWKKGCTFAPAKMASEKMRPRKIFEKRFGQLKKRLYLCTRKQSD